MIYNQSGSLICDNFDLTIPYKRGVNYGGVILIQNVMYDDCIECSLPVTQCQQGLLCDGCERWQHRKCNTGLSQQSYREAVTTGHNIDWRFAICTRLRAVVDHVPEDEDESMLGEYHPACTIDKNR